MSEKLQTVTFFPDGTTKQKSKDARSLSTTGRLMAYRDQLKKNLDNGIHFTEILNQLITTDDAMPNSTKPTYYQVSQVHQPRQYYPYSHHYAKFSKEHQNHYY